MSGPQGGGVGGGSLEPAFCPPNILYTSLNCTLQVPYRLKVLLLLRITAVETSLVAAMRGVCSGRTGVEHACISCWQHCDKIKDACKAILGTREFTSCSSSDVTPPAVLLTLVPSLVEIQSQLKQQMQHRQPCKWVCKPCSYYGSASVAKRPQKQSQSIKMSRGSMPPETPQSCMLMHVYIHIRQTM